jgi:hypothetical protein
MDTREIESTENPNTCLVGGALSLGDIRFFLGDLREGRKVGKSGQRKGRKREHMSLPLSTPHSQTQ